MLTEGGSREVVELEPRARLNVRVRTVQQVVVLNEELNGVGGPLGEIMEVVRNGVAVGVAHLTKEEDRRATRRWLCA